MEITGIFLNLKVSKVAPYDAIIELFTIFFDTNRYSSFVESKLKTIKTIICQVL